MPTPTETIRAATTPTGEPLVVPVSQSGNAGAYQLPLTGVPESEFWRRVLAAQERTGQLLLGKFTFLGPVQYDILQRSDNVFNALLVRRATARSTMSAANAAEMYQQAAASLEAIDAMVLRRRAGAAAGALALGGLGYWLFTRKR